MATTTATRTTTTRPARTITAPTIILAAALATPLAFGMAFAGVGFFSVFPPVVIGSVVAALVAVGVALIDRRWMHVVGAVVALLVFALGASDPTPGAMTRPSLGVQMSWGHTARFAGLIGLLAGVVALRASRGRAPGRIARATPSLAAVALGLVVGIGATTAAAVVDPGFLQGGTVVALEPDATVPIVESGDIFEVGAGAIGPGALVKLVVENRDGALHSVTTTQGPHVDVDTLAGRTTEILARAPSAPGDWTFVCKYHPGMRGAIRVG